jgi:hypothetical protein
LLLTRRHGGRTPSSRKRCHRKSARHHTPVTDATPRSWGRVASSNLRRFNPRAQDRRVVRTHRYQSVPLTPPSDTAHAMRVRCHAAARRRPRAASSVKEIAVAIGMREQRGICFPQVSVPADENRRDRHRGSWTCRSSSPPRGDVCRHSGAPTRGHAITTEPLRSTVLARRPVSGQTPRSTSRLRPPEQVRGTERSERSSTGCAPTTRAAHAATARARRGVAVVGEEPVDSCVCVMFDLPVERRHVDDYVRNYMRICARAAGPGVDVLGRRSVLRR